MVFLVSSYSWNNNERPKPRNPLPQVVRKTLNPEFKRQLSSSSFFLLHKYAPYAALFCDVTNHGCRLFWNLQINHEFHKDPVFPYRNKTVNPRNANFPWIHWIEVSWMLENWGASNAHAHTDLCSVRANGSVPFQWVMHLFLVKVEEGSGCLAARVLVEQRGARLSCDVMLPGEGCLQISSVGSFLFIAAAVLNG